VGRRAALERALREAIGTGLLTAGTRLPATRTLAAQLCLARGTVSAAYDQLAAEGYVRARTGAGTVVAELPAGRPGGATPAAAAGPPAPPRYDLRPGLPDVTTFPVAAWLRSTRRALAAAPAQAYGHGDPCGRPELRTALAGYLGRVRGVRAEPDRIVVTSGYVQALNLLVAVLGAGAVFAMEDPGMPFHRNVVRRAGGLVVPLPVDADGARTDLLGSPGYPPVAAAVLTPAHQYPTGAVLHPARRGALADWARTGGGLVVEDDYDGEFRYDRQPVGAVQGTAPDHVAYVGTAAKTLSPALRLAWLVLPRRLVAPVAQAKRYADLHTPVIEQLALADLIDGHGYDRHVRACRLRYRRRRDRLVQRLGPGAGHRYGLDGIAAGLHALVRLPGTEAGEAALIARAAALGLAIEGLGEHWHTPGTHRAALIVGYGTPTEARYPGALDALARVLAGAGGTG